MMSDESWIETSSSSSEKQPASLALADDPLRLADALIRETQAEADGELQEFIAYRAALIRARRKKQTGVDRMAAPKDALAIAAFLGKTLDPWQINTLTAPEHDILLLVSRQGGKGEVTSLLALEKLITKANSTTVITARSDRQSKRLLRRIKRYYRRLNNVPEIVIDSSVAFEIGNGSEILALPGSEETIRGIEAVDLLLIDEAALTPDDLFQSVYPMLATTNGRCVAMTTPRGKRGWFWREWDTTAQILAAGGKPDWHRESIDWTQIPRTRISEEFFERARRRLGEFMFRQEYGVEFLDAESQLFASHLIAKALTKDAAVANPYGFTKFGSE